MAANGLSVPTKITLAGTGVTQVAGPVYQVTLSVTAAGGNASSVAITPTAKDAAGSTISTTGSYVNVSYNAGTGSSDVARIATISGNTITAVHKGQAIVEFAYPAFDVDGLNAIGSGKVYALVQVNVLP